MPRESASETGGPPTGNTWGFAAAVGAGITVAGFALDFALKGRGFPTPAWPDNGIALGLFLLFQLAVWLLLRRGKVFAGLSGTRMAVVTLALLGVWAVLAGTLPQVARGEDAPIYRRVIQSPPFVLLLLLLIANIGWGALRHLSRGLSGASLFLFSHIGIHVTLCAGLFGGGDELRLDVWVEEGKTSWTGTGGNQQVELPFAIHLHRFSIDWFDPQLTVVRSGDGLFILPKGVDPLTLRPGKTAELMDHRVHVHEVTKSAPWSVEGDAIPAARITATDKDGNTKEGWVSSGSPLMPPMFVAIEKVGFAMTPPKPRRFHSEVTLLRPDQPPMKTEILVNRPLRFGPWWIYQKGYNLDGGPDARYSQFEAVRDPWLPAVYSGLALLAIGALLGLGRAAALLSPISQTDPP